ncbi:hypothetical protein RFI_26015 [Reticulomyxa filosa]|uniref:Uncharacterized protein n=1 Tax=Reticulomyxa filosa TaxID=46433 RepID=X6MD76_RETFI|nr:hypothetical protein RFI_26015 [Reticulomyxa filosa]|eukprot:ETO11362.1 hypothetical protein RFI_26015 [Reticulomyxa filosa]
MIERLILIDILERRIKFISYYTYPKDKDKYKDKHKKKKMHEYKNSQDDGVDNANDDDGYAAAADASGSDKEKITRSTSLGKEYTPFNKWVTLYDDNDGQLERLRNEITATKQKKRKITLKGPRKELYEANLPLLMDAQHNEREQLFKEKLKLCRAICDFYDLVDNIQKFFFGNKWWRREDINIKKKNCEHSGENGNDKKKDLKIEQSKVYCPNGKLSSTLNKSIQDEVQSQSGSSTVSFSMEGYSIDTKESKEDSSQTTCRWTGTLKSLEEHLINCDYQSVPCHFHNIGCEHIIVQANTHLHNQYFVTKHLQLKIQSHLQVMRYMQKKQKIKKLSWSLRMEERIEKIEMEMRKKLETLEKKNEELTSMVLDFAKSEGFDNAMGRPAKYFSKTYTNGKQLFVDKREDPYYRYQSCSIGLGVDLSYPDIHCHVLNLLKDKLLISSGQEKEKDKDADNIRFLEIGPKAFGVEFNPELIAQAQKNAASIGLTQLVEFGTMNFHPNQWRANIRWAEKGPFDAIYCGDAVTRDDVFTLNAKLKNKSILIIRKCCEN